MSMGVCVCLSLIVYCYDIISHKQYILQYIFFPSLSLLRKYVCVYVCM